MIDTAAERVPPLAARAACPDLRRTLDKGRDNNTRTRLEGTPVKLQTISSQIRSCDRPGRHT